MKVKIIKGNRAGEIVEASDKRAAYWQRVGLAEEVTTETAKEVKKTAPKKKKK
jgi:hypothetical protein